MAAVLTAETWALPEFYYDADGEVLTEAEIGKLHLALEQQDPNSRKLKTLDCLHSLLEKALDRLHQWRDSGNRVTFERMFVQPDSFDSVKEDLEGLKRFVVGTKLAAIGNLLPVPLPNEIVEMIWETVLISNKRSGFKADLVPCIGGIGRNDPDKVVLLHERLFVLWAALKNICNHLKKEVEQDRWQKSRGGVEDERVKIFHDLLSDVKRAGQRLLRFFCPDEQGNSLGSDVMGLAKQGRFSLSVRHILPPPRFASGAGSLPDAVFVRWSTSDPSLALSFRRSQSVVTAVVWNLKSRRRVATVSIWEDVLQLPFSHNLNKTTQAFLTGDRLYAVTGKRCATGRDRFRISTIAWQVDLSGAAEDQILLMDDAACTSYITADFAPGDGDGVDINRDIRDEISLQFSKHATSQYDVLKLHCIKGSQYLCKSYDPATGSLLSSVQVPHCLEGATLQDHKGNQAIVAGSDGCYIFDSSTGQRVISINLDFLDDPQPANLHSVDKDNDKRRVWAAFDQSPTSSLLVVVVAKVSSCESDPSTNGAANKLFIFKTDSELEAETPLASANIDFFPDQTYNRHQLILSGGIVFFVKEVSKRMLSASLWDPAKRPTEPPVFLCNIGMSSNCPEYPARFGGLGPSASAVGPHSLLLPGAAHEDFRRKKRESSWLASRRWAVAYYPDPRLYQLNFKLRSADPTTLMIVTPGSLTEIKLGEEADAREIMEMMAVEERWRRHWNDEDPELNAWDSECEQSDNEVCSPLQESDVDDDIDEGPWDEPGIPPWYYE